MWKLYISGDSESGYQCLLRTGIETVPLLQFPEITDSWVKGTRGRLVTCLMLGIDKKLYISTPEEIEVIRCTQKLHEEVVQTSRQQARRNDELKLPSEASIAFAALIVDLNHFSQYYFFDNTPEGQRFSFETHKQMGGRKLNHDRD